MCCNGKGYLIRRGSESEIRSINIGVLLGKEELRKSKIRRFDVTLY